jgi:hypothetical protein
LGAVAQTQQVNQAERNQLQELRAEALTLADWIADNRATGHSNLAINEKKLEDLLKNNGPLLQKDSTFTKTLLSDRRNHKKHLI